MNLCPICTKDDAVQKVTTVVSNGNQNGTISGPTGGLVYSDGKFGYAAGYSVLNGKISTDLAKKLAAPEKPFAQVELGLGCLYFFLVIAMMVCAVSLNFVPAAIILAILIAITIPLSKRPNPEEVLLKQTMLWESKMAVYDRLYYCHRDDVVFDPVNHKYISSKNMSDLLQTS